MENPAKEKTRASSDIIQVMLTFGATALVFAPTLFWLLQRTGQNEQLKQALILIGALGTFLAWENRDKLRPSFEHDRRSMVLLALSYLLAGLQFLSPTLPLLPLGMVLAVAGLMRFTFGNRGKRVLRALVFAFMGFVLIAILLPVFDWPLRILAGKWSAMLIGLFDSIPSLYITGTDVPHLAMNVNGRVFIVAAECNGYGLLSSSILLTVLLGYYQSLKKVDYLLLIAVSIISALIGNLLRIFVIIELAPRISNYDLMHEIVGLVFYYLTLGFVGWLTWTCPHRQKQAE